ncbi:MAG: helix-hairpin-helix domain-containing protein [Lachnospiraceae bacterium]|nr:helix-hairpin-helix domain-containing protein [Lachnospiraceae bacterium]
MKKEIKGALAAAALLSALILTSCGDNGEMTLSRLEAQNADEGGSPLSMPDDGSTQNESDPAAGVAEELTIVVYICGSVQDPGVYELPAGSRVCDGLEAAGGFSEGADEKRINLAGMLEDGDMVFFPEVGEELAEGASDYITGREEQSATDALININTAGEQALCTLPGIGSSKAQAIISYREEHGSFKDIKEIMNVNGIGENLFNQIKDLIRV